VSIYLETFLLFIEYTPANDRERIRQLLTDEFSTFFFKFRSPKKLQLEMYLCRFELFYDLIPFAAYVVGAGGVFAG
jgi:hypothetical protein